MTRLVTTSEDLRGVSIVELQESAESLSTSDFSVSFFARVLDQLVAEPLVAAFPMVVIDESLYGSSKGSLGEEDHPIKALALDG